MQEGYTVQEVLDLAGFRSKALLMVWEFKPQKSRYAEFLQTQLAANERIFHAAPDY